MSIQAKQLAYCEISNKKLQKSYQDYVEFFLHGKLSMVDSKKENMIFEGGLLASYLVLMSVLGYYITHFTDIYNLSDLYSDLL